MPFLKLTSNAVIGEPLCRQLIEALSKTLAAATGKPERYVMVEVSSGHCMLFAGNDQPLAYLECKSIGLTTVQAKALSASLPPLLTQFLGIGAERVYIEFSSCPAEFWGWNGSTFG